jgi:hypothetical protein
MDNAKACFKCGVEKPLADFYRHPRMADGHLNKCRECTKRDVTEHRDKSLDKIRAYDRVRGSRRTPEAVARWMENGGREKKRAHQVVKRAVARGDLTPRPCEVCGATDRIHAHHDDYAKALDVRWLCVKHHRQHHAGRMID